MEVDRSVQLAIHHKDLDSFAKALAEHAGPMDAIQLYDAPLICWTARQGWAEGIEHLIAAGSRPDRIPGVLHAGIFPTNLTTEDVRPLELLIEAGADVNVEGGTLQMTPLQYAAMVIEERGEAITRLLLAHGADPNAAPRRTEPPLHHATVRPCSGTVRALLEHGADPHWIDEEGDGLILILLFTLKAALGRDDGSPEIAEAFAPPTLRALLDHGADATSCSASGRSPLWFTLAMRRCPAAIQEMLLDAGAPLGTIQNGDEELDFLAMSLLRRVPPSVARRLIDAGCPMDVDYENLGGTYVMSALRFEPAFSLALLDESPAFAAEVQTARNERGVNMLAFAALGEARDAVTPQQVTLVRRLHAEGLSARAVSTSGKSAAEVVAPHNPAIVPLLRELAAAES